MNVIYSIDLKKLEKNYNDFAKFGKVYFPVKTNSNQIILDKLLELGSGFECDSLDHIQKVYTETNADDIIYSNVVKSYEDILWAVRHKLTFYTVDDENTLRTIIDLAKENNFNYLNINVRLNIYDIFRKEFEEKGVMDSRLGASVLTCKKLLNILNNEKGIQINKGISFYVQVEVHNNENILEKVTDYIVNNFSSDDKIEWVNIGGGSPIKRIFASLPKIKENLQKIGAEKIILEPGRYLVGDIENLIVPIKRVINSKLNDNELIASLAIGIYSGLLDIKLHNRKFTYILNNNGNQETLVEWDNVSTKLVLRGPTADSSDILGIFNKPELEINSNSVIEIQNVGAYVEVLYSDFSGKCDISYVVKNDLENN